MFPSDRRHRRAAMADALSVTLLAFLGGHILLLAADQILLENDSNQYDGDSCELKNGRAGVCRPANECRWVTEMRSPTQDLITCSFNMSLPIVCCPEQAGSILKNTLKKRISATQCEQYPNTTGLADHIFNGVAAQYGEFPHMAALGYDSPTGPEARSTNLFRCSASLIASRFLLTAAHCLHEMPVFARLGVLELQPARVIDEPLDIMIRKGTSHPNYNSITYQNDIAVLELADSVPDVWPFVDPICLYPNATAGPPGPDETLFVQGWGTEMPGDTEPALRLMKANLTIVEREACNSSLPRNRRNPTGLHPGQLCALGRNERNETVADTCPGDSGGPLELAVEGRHYLLGIISIGFACGSPIPGIYTEVAYYLDWIESIVWP